MAAPHHGRTVTDDRPRGHPLNPRAYFRHTSQSLQREIEVIHGRNASASGDARRLALAERELQIVEAELATLERIRDESPPTP
jgi:hypothetical protein